MNIYRIARAVFSDKVAKPVWLLALLLPASPCVLGEEPGGHGEPGDTECEEDCTYSFSRSISESAGPRYRKISLLGLPIPDEKPTLKEETDEAKEETYIDALNHTLSHSVTDVYIPIGGSDLVLSARRNVVPEIWNNKSGLRPSDPRPDKPFGQCWSTNLIPNIEFISSSPPPPPPGPPDALCPPAKPEPTYAMVTDESGATFKFVVLHHGLTGVAFFPMPSERSDIEDAAVSLESVGNGEFVLTKKFGTKIRYFLGVGAPVLSFAGDRLNLGSGAQPSGSETHMWARATSVEDKFGTVMSFDYGGLASTLIPESITCRGVEMTIGRSANGRLIEWIDDPAGNRTVFNYPVPDDGNVRLLSVEKPEEATTWYTYHFASHHSTEPYTVGQTTARGNFYYADVQSITDPNGNAFTFTYAFDFTKYNLRMSEAYTGYYPSSGQPRNITKVSSAAGEAKFYNLSATFLLRMLTTPSYDGAREMTVIDVMNNTRHYSFTDFQVTVANFLEDFLGLGESRQTPMLVIYKKMKIFLPMALTEEFTFKPEAGMEVASVTDVNGNTTSFDYENAIDLQSQFIFLDQLAANYYYGDPTKQTNALNKSKHYEYDTTWHGVLKKLTDEEGRVTEYEIEQTYGRRTKETVRDSAEGPVVRETLFEYSETYPAFLTKQTVVGGRGPGQDLVTEYVPTEDGRCNVWKEIVDPGAGNQHLKLTTTTTYDANNNRKTVTDPRQHATTFDYDGLNRLVKTIFPDNKTKEFEYYPRGNKKWEKDENGHLTHFEYNGLNRLIKQTRDMDEDDLVTQYTYNPLGALLTEIDPEGNTTTYGYDVLQRKVSEVRPVVGETTFVYGENSGSSTFDTSAFKATSMTDPRPVTTVVVYDDLYRPLSTTVGGIPTGTTAYDDVGNPTTVTDGLGKVTTSEYDALNRVEKVIYHDGTEVLTEYTPAGLVTKVTDELGEATDTYYDAAGRAWKVVGPPDQNEARPETENHYDAAGNLTKTINPLDEEWDYEYNSRNRKTEERAPAVNGSRPTVLTEYDGVGNLKKKTDARLAVTEFFYDSANRQTDVKAPAVNGVHPNTHTEYDLNGNVHTVEDPNGHTVTNVYDALNRLESTTDEEGITVAYEYDEVGNRTEVEDGKGNVTTFEYDTLNRNTKIIDDEGETTTFVYNEVNKTSRVDQFGKTTIYAYDDRHRLETVTYSERTQDNRTYDYDLKGNLESVEIAGYANKADVRYTYDALGRVLTEKSGGFTHTYTYDLAGNRRTATYGGTAMVITSTYDALNRLHTMTENTRLTTYGYDANGNVTSKTLPGGEVITQTYDALNRRETISTANYAFVYTHDLAGNLLTSTEVYPNNPTMNRVVTNVYEDNNRLHSETVTGSGAVTTVYTYDDANNRLTMTKGGVTTTYAHNGVNEMESWNDGTSLVSFEYDDAGNRTERKLGGVITHEYEYDQENRLVEVTDLTVAPPKVYEYVYDYRTRRVERDESAAGGAVTSLSFSGGTSVQEREGGAVSVEYVRGSDHGGGVGGVLYTLRGGTPSYSHYNSRGDVIGKTTGAGSLTYLASYEAFGQRTAEVGATADRQKANTKDEDPTGLLNEGFRYRDLETGVFITRDPAGFVDGPNLYTYVVQNPWTKFDPEGLSEEEIAKVEWHHEVPQDVNNPLHRLAEEAGYNPDDIHSKENGTLLPKEPHRIKAGNGIETTGPESARETWGRATADAAVEWRTNNPNQTPTKAVIREIVEKLKTDPRFAEQFSKGVKANLNYRGLGSWEDLGDMGSKVSHFKAARAAATGGLLTKIGKWGKRGLVALGIGAALYGGVENVRANGVKDGLSQTVWENTPPGTIYELGVKPGGEAAIDLGTNLIYQGDPHTGANQVARLLEAD